MFQRICTTILCLFIAAVSAQSSTDSYSSYYLIGAGISLAIWGAIAILGYFIGDWQVAACILVFLFGICGICCALAMPTRTQLREQASAGRPGTEGNSEISQAAAQKKMNQSDPSLWSDACRDSSTNAYWNNATAIPDQSLSNAVLLQAFFLYVTIGGASSVFNIICLVTFVTNKELREKYFLFAVLAFANLINTVFTCQAGYLRRYLIFTNQFQQLRSTFECLKYPNPHLQLIGGQLPAVVLLVIDIERFIAVYKPIFYKVHINYRTRIYTVIGCCVAVFISLLFGYLSSYMNRFSCTSALCAVRSAYGLNYSNYNSAIVILFPIIAFILNVLTYVGAKRLNAHANMKRELKLILLTLIITFVDVLLIAAPNFVIFGVYNRFITIPLADQCFCYVIFCCNSAINLFVYIFLKRDFRNHLLMSISFGTLRSYLKVSNETSVIQGSHRVVPQPVSNIRIVRSASSTME